MDEQLQQLSPEARQAVIEKMTLEQKAKHGYLPDYLSIKEICDLRHPTSWPAPKRTVDRAARESWELKRKIKAAYQQDLIAACETGLLKYEGDIKGWDYYQNTPNPYPLAKSGRHTGKPPKQNSYLLGSREWHGEFNRQPLTNRLDQKYYCYKCEPEDCTIHKDEFKRFLESVNKWPLIGLLANWWPNSEHKGMWHKDGIDSDINEHLLNFIDSNDTKIQQINKQI